MTIFPEIKTLCSIQPSDRQTRLVRTVIAGGQTSTITSL
jgi:hypothetical protein